MARVGTRGGSSAVGRGAGGIPPSAAPRPIAESPAGGRAARFWREPGALGAGMPAEQLGGLTPSARPRRTPAGPGSPAWPLERGACGDTPSEPRSLLRGVPLRGVPAGGGCPRV